MRSNDATPAPRRLSRRLLRWTYVLYVAIGIAYVASYGMLRTRGVREARSAEMPVFFYVSIAQYAASTRACEWHFRLARGYAPLNWIDVHCCGGMPASRGGIRRLVP